MRGKELLQRIWNLEPVERPAIIVEESIGYRPSFLDTHIPLDDYHTQYQRAIEEYESLRQDRDDNVPALMTAMGTFVMPTVFGAQIRSFPDGRRYIHAPVIRDAQDVDSIRPLAMEETILGQQIRLLESFAQKTGGNVPVRMPDLQNPLGIAEMLWETESFYAALAEEPEQVHRLLEMITEVLIDSIHRIRNVCRNFVPVTWPFIWAPADKGVHLSDDTMSMISPAMYEEYGVRYNNHVSREFGGIYLHSCTTNRRYFESIMKNENLRSINFAAQYSSDMTEIFEFFGGKVVILPHYVHTDSPQIGTLPQFIDKVLDCWTPATPCIIYVSPRPDGGPQQEVFDALSARHLHMT